MSIYISMEHLGLLDGVSPVVFSDFTWSPLGTDGASFRGVASPRLPIGIVDWREIILGLEDQFGPIVDRVAPDAGSSAKLTDLILERAIVFAPTATAGGLVSGTHTPSGPGIQARLWETPGFRVTETADMFQAGGTGQVAIGGGAGAAGTVVLPTGLRWYIDSTVANAEENVIGVWLIPFIAPATFSELANAGRPLPT